jgi:PAS domain S-box-containing protein
MANQDDVRREPTGHEPRSFLLTTDILENIPDAFAVLDRDWRYLYLNAAAERLLGRKREELLGKTIWDEYPEAVGTALEEGWRGAMEQRIATHVEEFYPGIGWVEEHSYPSDEGIWIFFQNITERKHQQEALKETTDRLERTVAALKAQRAEALTMMESIPEGFLALDRDWRLVSINAMGARILGSSREALLGKVIWEAFPETVGSPFEAAWRRAMDERTTGHVEAYYPPLEGWFEEHAYPSPEGTWIFFQNITERKRQQQALEETTARLQRTVVELEDARKLEERARLEVEDAARWSAFLAEVERILASTLDYRTVLDSLVHAAVPTIADVCGFNEVGEDGQVYTVAVAAGDRAREQEIIQRLKEYPLKPDQEEGIARAVRTGEPEFYPEITDDLLRRTTRNAQSFEVVRSLGFRSGMIIPLVARRKALGAIWFAITTSGRRFDETDLARARDLVSRAALATENALLYRDVERAEKRSRFLAEAGTILASSLDYEVTLQSVARLTVPLLADYCIIDLAEDDTLRPVATAHRDPALDQRLAVARSSPPAPARGMLQEVLRSGKARLVPEVTPAVYEALAYSPEHLELLGTMAAQAYMLVPLTARGRTLGVVTLANTDPDRRYTPADLALAEELARRAAVAVDNALLYREVERAAQRSRFLAEAGEVFASAMADYEATLQNVARLSVPLLGDYCIIDLIEDGSVHRVAAAHHDPAKDRLMQSLTHFPLTSVRGPLGQVIRTGTSVRIPDVTPAIQEEIATSPQHLELLRTLGARSMLLVPLTARGRTLGAITLSAGAERPPYDAEEQALAEDLARRAALAVDNARLYQESLAANRAKSDFLAVVSHELRTPLNAIIGYTDLLRTGIAGPLTEEQGRQLARVDASAHHLLLLIEEVLTFSRMEAGREEVQLRIADVGELLRVLSAPSALQAEGKGLAFHLDLPDTPLRVRTDPAKVRQIVANLLSNAVKFTERGEVTLSARQEGDALLVRVKDSGLGIAPENFEKIFEPFWQAEPATTRRAGGTGLGLPVSRRLARLLGGDITVESARGQGSTFTLRLPLTPPPHPGAPPPAL